MMPIYVYRCMKCGKETKEYRSMSSKKTPPKCSECRTEMKKVPGKPSGAIITEKDKVRGRHFKRDVTEELKKRSHEHFVNNEMDDLIQEHGVDSAKDFGWVDRKTGKKKRLIDEK